MRGRWLDSVAAAAVLAAALTVAAEAPKAKSPPATTPVFRRTLAWQQRHDAINARVRQGQVDLIFIGDSIVEGWEKDGREVWQAYYARRQAVNLGISGDQTGHVLWRLTHGNIDGISPKLAVVLIGTNNARWAGHSGAEIAQGVKAIVAILREKLPQTRILLLAIFPRGADDTDPLRQANDTANRILATLADGDRVHFLDLSREFLRPDGRIDPELMPDLLHLNAKGYAIWARAVEPIVAKLLGELP